jgi:hypothetical protein
MIYQGSIMKEKIAVATVDGKAYFLIVNKLLERNIPFISLIPHKPVPTKVQVVLTTEKEESAIKHDKVLVFKDENELDHLTSEIEKILQGKVSYEKIVIGIDPGEAVGFAFIADGKINETENCFSINEVLNKILKIIKEIDFSLTKVLVRIGNGTPSYRELLEVLDNVLPPQVVLEVVNEAGTNRPLEENKCTRRIRHIYSAIWIARRSGYVSPRKRAVEANI